MSASFRRIKGQTPGSTGEAGICPQPLSILPAILWAGLIFWGSSLPSNNLPPLFPHADILIHFCEYFILTWLVSLALKKNFPSFSTVKTAVLVLIICLIYAASDEFHQFFVPGRTPDIIDWLVDGTAVLVFLRLFLGPVNNPG